MKQTSLADDEMITAVVLPEEVPTAQEFAKIGIRSAMVISTVSCVVMRASDGFRVALGSVAPTVIRARAAEEMLNAETTVTEGVLAEFVLIVSKMKYGRSPTIDRPRPTE